MTAKIIIYRKALKIANWTDILMLIQEASIYSNKGFSIVITSSALHKYIELTVNYNNTHILYIMKYLRKIYNKENIKIKIRRNNKISIDDIVLKVCDHYNIDKSIIFSKTRKREIVEARQIVQSIAKAKLKLSLSEIGLKTGGYDHATVLNSIKVINNLRETNKQFNINIEKFEKSLWHE